MVADRTCPDCGSALDGAMVRKVLSEYPDDHRLNDPPIGPGYECPDCEYCERV